MLAFAPDAIDIAPEILSAVSAVPTIRGYKTPPSGVSMNGNVFVGTPQGSARVVDRDGTSRTFVGTSTYLYEYQSGSWTDRSRAGNYSAGSARWAFLGFGSTELAINKTTQLQQSSSGAFSNVSNAPKAAIMFSVGAHVMLLNCDDTGTGLGTGYGDQGDRWWCSQTFSPTSSWDPTPGTSSAANRCTSGQLVEAPGAITAGNRLGGDAVAYKEDATFLGRWTQGAEVFSWKCVANDIGCPARDGLVNVGAKHYFIGKTDVYEFDGGSRPVPIGSSIRNWFFGRLNLAYMSGIQSLHDKLNKVIFWFYPSGSDGTLNSVLCYHYDTQRWGAFDITVKEVIDTVTNAITYDSLGSLYATYDDLPAIPYDSPFWNASSPVLAYLSSTQYLMSLTGAASSMTLTTGWYGDEAEVSTCTRVRPRMRSKATSGTVSGQTVMALGDTPGTGSTGATLHDGRFDVLQTARYHRFMLTLNGACEIEAVSPTLIPQGSE